MPGGWVILMPFLLVTMTMVFHYLLMCYSQYLLFCAILMWALFIQWRDVVFGDWWHSDDGIRCHWFSIYIHSDDDYCYHWHYSIQYLLKLTTDYILYSEPMEWVGVQSDSIADTISCLVWLWYSWPLTLLLLIPFIVGIDDGRLTDDGIYHCSGTRTFLVIRYHDIFCWWCIGDCLVFAVMPGVAWWVCHSFWYHCCCCYGAVDCSSTYLLLLFIHSVTILYCIVLVFCCFIILHLLIPWPYSQSLLSLMQYQADDSTFSILTIHFILPKCSIDIDCFWPVNKWFWYSFVM